MLFVGTKHHFCSLYTLPFITGSGQMGTTFPIVLCQNGSQCSLDPANEIYTHMD